MDTTVLRTKLYIPRTRADSSKGLKTSTVPRPRLIERLNEGLHRKLTLISAPAGFGKTTLLSSWIDDLRFDIRTVYQIRVKGHLDEHWSEWFDDLTVTYDEHDNALLTGPVIDQAALYGLLKKVHDLGLRLISVNPVKTCAHNKGKKRRKKERQLNSRKGGI